MWHVIIPVKEWDAAKSRLALPSADRRALAEAMATDTIAAATSADAVAHVTVVTTSPAMGASPALAEADAVLVQPPGDLDDALQWAAQQVVPSGMPVTALVADLPSLTSSALDAALRVAESENSAFVIDRHGSGSTMLTALSPEGLRPSFGPNSAARHVALGATLLPASAVAPSLACDVDTLNDLATAGRLGLGRYTSLVAHSLGSLPGSLGSAP
jgi:2-phospho-L-lactate guanylyltransferase